MHLAYLAFVDLTGGSGENLFSRELVAAIGRQGDVELSVICPEPLGDLPPSLRSDGTRFYFLPPKARGSLRWHLGSQRPLLGALRRAGRDRGSLDGMVATLRLTSLLPPVFSRTLGVPQVLVVEGLEARNVGRMSSVPGAKAGMEAITFFNAATSRRIFAAYGAIRDWIGAMPMVDQAKIELFHHGVNGEVFPDLDRAEARARLGLPYSGSEFVVGFVGSFKWYHRVDVLLEAVAHVDDPDLHVMLIGEGPELDAARALADELGLGKRARFTGAVDHDLVGTYMASCDLLHGARDPSHWSNPIKVYEYMASGRPVVAFRTAELAFVEEIGAGILLDDVTPATVRGAIRHFQARSAEERREIGGIGRARVLSEHTWDRLAGRIVATLAPDASGSAGAVSEPVPAQHPADG